MGDTSAIEDIAEKLETDRELFGEDENKMGGQIWPEDKDIAPDEEGRYEIPAYVEE